MKTGEKPASTQPMMSEEQKAVAQVAGQFVENRIVDLLGWQQLTLATPVASLPAAFAFLAFGPRLRVYDI